MPNALFWDSTYEEVGAVLERVHECEKNAYMRAGLIAATIVNVHRPKGARLVKPGDFFREPHREEDFMDVDTATQVMDSWSVAMNRGYTS